MQLSTDQVAKALRVSSGALVQSVSPNSAAAKAGLLPTRRGLTGIITGATPTTHSTLLYCFPENAAVVLSCTAVQESTTAAFLYMHASVGC